MPIFISKSIGQTPNELINEYKSKNPMAKKVSFAGRLDPMAYGKMMLLVNEECKLQPHYIGLDKIYDFEIVYGLSTDTYDILGLVTGFTNIFNVQSLYSIETLDLNTYIKKFEQTYPPYSSIVVNKKPLWEWSKLGKIDTITIPSKQVEIYSLETIENTHTFNDYNDLYTHIIQSISNLSEENKPKFRFNDIVDSWRDTFETLDIRRSQHLSQFGPYKPLIKKYRATVSSGTYIRSLAHQIGKDVGCGAIAMNIRRVEFI
jgi:tRNA pseudouridine(55) synthase